MSTEIIDNLIDIIPNEYEDSNCPIFIIPPECEASGQRAISFKSGKINEDGHSLKPGNIIINWKKFCLLGCESIFPIAAATHMPCLSLFAAIVICNKFWSLLNIPITGLDAIVIWTMWKNKDQYDCIETKNILGLVNAELSTYAYSNIDQEKLEMTIKNLEKMKCIKKDEENKWRLVEEIKEDFDKPLISMNSL